jgi:Holliday junction resolvase RusA-like endonuclease
LDNRLKSLFDAVAHAGCVEGDHLCAKIEARWGKWRGVRVWIIATTEPEVAEEVWWGS